MENATRKPSAVAIFLDLATFSARSASVSASPGLLRSALELPPLSMKISADAKEPRINTKASATNNFIMMFVLSRLYDRQDRRRTSMLSVSW